MFYAGNGKNLVSFEKKSERDYFVFKHPAYMAEIGRASCRERV